MTGAQNEGSGATDRRPARVPAVARVALIGVLAAIVVVLLFTVVFPWFDRTFVNDPVMGRGVPPPTAVDDGA